MSHIFVSYKSEDRGIIEPIVEDLKRHYYVWFDQTDIDPGTPDWFDAVNRGLTEASALIVMLSPASVQSKWVEYEYKTAQQRGIRVFTYIIQNVEPPSDLATIQFLRHAKPGDYEKLIDNLPSESRIWGGKLITPGKDFSSQTFGDLSKAVSDECLFPQPSKGLVSFDLVGLPIKQTRFHKIYLVGRKDEKPTPQPVVQIALQLTTRDFSLSRKANGDYPQDDLVSSIASHFLQSPRDSIRLFLIRGPLLRPHDATNTTFGLKTSGQSEWEDTIVALKEAQTFYSDRPKIQLFVNGPAILTYKLGAENATLRSYELFQLDFSTQKYFSVLSS